MGADLQCAPPARPATRPLFQDKICTSGPALPRILNIIPSELYIWTGSPRTDMYSCRVRSLMPAAGIPCPLHSLPPHPPARLLPQRPRELLPAWWRAPLSATTPPAAPSPTPHLPPPPNQPLTGRGSSRVSLPPWRVQEAPPPPPPRSAPHSLFHPPTVRKACSR